MAKKRQSLLAKASKMMIHVYVMRISFAFRLAFLSQPNPAPWMEVSTVTWSQNQVNWSFTVFHVIKAHTSLVPHLLGPQKSLKAAQCLTVAKNFFLSLPHTFFLLASRDFNPRMTYKNANQYRTTGCCGSLSYPPRLHLRNSRAPHWQRRDSQKFIFPSDTRSAILLLPGFRFSSFAPFPFLCSFTLLVQNRSRTQEERKKRKTLRRAERERWAFIYQFSCFNFCFFLSFSSYVVDEEWRWERWRGNPHECTQTTRKKAPERFTPFPR